MDDYIDLMDELESNKKEMAKMTADTEEYSAEERDELNCTPCQGHFLLFVVGNILLFFYNSTQWIITCCYIFIIFIWR